MAIGIGCGDKGGESVDSGRGEVGRVVMVTMTMVHPHDHEYEEHSSSQIPQYPTMAMDSPVLQGQQAQQEYERQQQQAQQQQQQTPQHVQQEFQPRTL